MTESGAVMLSGEGNGPLETRKGELIATASPALPGRPACVLGSNPRVAVSSLVSRPPTGTRRRPIGSSKPTSCTRTTIAVILSATILVGSFYQVIDTLLRHKLID